MCDTLFSPAFLSKKGHAILAKNSDREPNEAQQIVRYPRQKRAELKAKTTFITVDCPEDVFEVILSKPFQMWGAEMGANEHKVVIGNEAVFTKIKMDKTNKGLTGMDMLRLALEQAKTAHEALVLIQNLLAKYGQDACGGYQDKGMFYHNSFIIADDTEGYVLETAGVFWVVKKISGYTAISNILTIETDFDDIHPETVAFAQKKGWIGRDEPFNFKKTFSEPIMTFLGKGKERRFHCVSQGDQNVENAENTDGTSRENREGGTFTVQDAFSILRSHKSGDDFMPNKGDMSCICLHATGLFTPSQTTGSMVVEIRKEQPMTVWLTGTSAPCLSFFKPFYFGMNILDESNFAIPTAHFDNSYWWQWEELHRKSLKKYQRWAFKLGLSQKVYEEDWLQNDAELIGKGNIQALSELSQSALNQSIYMKDAFLEEMEHDKNQALLPLKYYLYRRIKTTFLYKYYWYRQNKKVGL